MTESQMQSMPQVADIAAEALEVFCDDLAGMFDADMGCVRRDVTCGTLADLENAFAHLEAVCSFTAEGLVNGRFHILLDRDGAVTLAALLTATPRNEVLAKRTRASKEAADELHDATAEAANVLAASWERTCCAPGETKARFAPAATLVTNQWSELRQSALLAPEDEILALHCQMTIDPYAPFPLAIVFPKSLAADPNWSQMLPPEPENQQAPADLELLQPSPEPSSQPEPADPQEQVPPEPTDVVAAPSPRPEDRTLLYPPESQADDLPQQKTTPQPQQQQALDVADRLPQEQPETATPPANYDASAVRQSAENPPENTAQTPDCTPETGPISDAIKKMTASQPEQSAPPPAPCSGQATPLLSTPAAEIMQTDLAWADPEDTIEAVLAKMHEYNVSHVIVGRKTAPLGIVSRSDIAAAMSPYLRPTFSKWRRPLDDATLRIKVKWIMSAPLTTIASDTPLSVMMEQMRQLHKRALPVLGAHGTIVGMITAFDIFAALLKPAQAP